MDKYDEHIAELNALSGEKQRRKIATDWLDAKGLFQFLCKVGCTNGSDSKLRRSDYGCPTMIRASQGQMYFVYIAETESLTKAAQEADLPMETSLIRPQHFETLARLQRQADSELGRV